MWNVQCKNVMTQTLSWWCNPKWILQTRWKQPQQKQSHNHKTKTLVFRWLDYELFSGDKLKNIHTLDNFFWHSVDIIGQNDNQPLKNSNMNQRIKLAPDRQRKQPAYMFINTFRGCFLSYKYLANSVHAAVCVSSNIHYFWFFIFVVFVYWNCSAIRALFQA